jgi:hypothetical protein
LGTRSSSSLSPCAWAASSSASNASSVPNTVDAGVIGNVVAEVRHGGGEDRREPDRVDGEFRKIGQAPANAFEIADAVAVRVVKRARVNLIDDAALPPVGHGGAYTKRIARNSGSRRPYCLASRVHGAIRPSAYWAPRPHANVTVAMADVRFCRTGTRRTAGLIQHARRSRSARTPSGPMRKPKGITTG